MTHAGEEGPLLRIEYRPVAVMSTPFVDPSGMPIQPSRARGVRGAAVVFPEFVEALADLDGFSHVIILSHLHRAKRYRPRVVPHLDTVERGLFATRAPSRPNPIGLSVFRLLGIDGARLEVQDVDLLDGTPVLDIKPHVPDFDEPAEVRIGWLKEARRGTVRSDARFAVEAQGSEPRPDGARSSERHLRVARSTAALERVVAMYRQGLRLELLGAFEDHDGFDGVMLGLPDMDYHLEFTRRRGDENVPRPLADELLVFYHPDRGEWADACDRMVAAGFERVAAANPYWDLHGVTFEDPEGYRVVLQNTAWTGGGRGNHSATLGGPR